MRYYPIMLNLEAKKVLIVGLGQIGLRKLTGLYGTGCELTVLTPKDLKIRQKIYEAVFRKISEETFYQESTEDAFIRAFVQNIRLIEEKFNTERHLSLIDESDVIFLCTNDPMLQAKLYDYAKNKGIWTLRCDDGASSDFITPIAVQKDELLIAISTSGSSPSYAKYFKDKIRELLKKTDTSMLKEMKENRRRR